MKGTKLSVLWQTYLEWAIPIICVTGCSAVPNTLRLPLVYLTGILFVAVTALDRRRVYFHLPNFSMMALLGYMAVQTLYSYDRAGTLDSLLLYACASTLLFMDIDEASMHRILRNIGWVCTVIACSIVLSSLVENCMLKYFSFIVNPRGSASISQAIRKELANGFYSGFAREKGEAAMIMNIGIAVIYARYFAHDALRRRDILQFLLYFAALMLTGKRMMAIIPVAGFASLLLISKVRHKAFRIVSIGSLGILFMIIGFIFVPKLGHVLNRFLDEDSMSNLTGRTELWQYLADMFTKAPVFGTGFNSFNSYAYDHGLRINGSAWSYNGHNSYYQGLAELGVVGFIPFVVFLGSALFASVKDIRHIEYPKPARQLVYFGCYIQIMFIVYAITGNPAYTTQYLFELCFATGLVLSLRRRYMRFLPYQGLQSTGKK